MFDKVCQNEVLWQAYIQVKANKGAPGIDQRTFEYIEEEIGIGKYLIELQAKLVEKRYKPLPVKRVYIPKTDGTKRPLGIPVITDRIIQAAVKMVIEPLV